MCDMWVQALAAPLRVRARHVDGMLLCHLLVSVLQVQENHSLENLLGFQCVFHSCEPPRLGALHLVARGGAYVAECCHAVAELQRQVPVANIVFYPLY